MVRVLRSRETNRDSVHGPPAGPHGCAPCAAGKGRCEPARTGAPLTESAGRGRRRHLPRCAHAQLRVVLNGAASFQTPGKPSFAARKRDGREGRRPAAAHASAQETPQSCPRRGGCLRRALRTSRLQRLLDTLREDIDAGVPKS